MKKCDLELERYTRRRMRELNGLAAAPQCSDPFVEAYTRRRIRELRYQYQSTEGEKGLDNAALGGYTVGTVEVHSG